MLDPYQLTLHTITLRQFASAEQIAEISGQPRDDVETALDRAVAEGTAFAARGAYLVSPTGQDLLADVYRRAFAAPRADPEIGRSMDAFEIGVNKQVLTLTTDWQTVELNGTRVPTDHGDPDYDARVLDRLGRVHDRTRTVLRPMAGADPLVDRFLDRLGDALTRAEGGELDYVSSVRVDSVHTVWFQMHEHLLRLTGRERQE